MFKALRDALAALSRGPFWKVSAAPHPALTIWVRESIRPTLKAAGYTWKDGSYAGRRGNIRAIASITRNTPTAASIAGNTPAVAARNYQKRVAEDMYNGLVALDDAISGEIAANQLPVLELPASFAGKSQKSTE